MPVLLSLAAALGYGLADFLAGISGRRATPGAAALIAQPLGLVAALVALLLLPADQVGMSALVWGAVSGVGSGVGTLSLYRGLARGRMSVVAPITALVTAAIPAVVGLTLGDRLGSVQLAGVMVAVPAVGLVSWRGGKGAGASRGIPEALLAGASFALLFVALDQAGTGAGTLPLVVGQAVALALVTPLGLATAGPPREWRPGLKPALVSGVLGGIANVCFLASTRGGQLAVVAVLTSLSPAVPVVLARLVLSETWGRVQVVGLGATVVAVALISL